MECVQNACWLCAALPPPFSHLWVSLFIWIKRILFLLPSAMIYPFLKKIKIKTSFFSYLQPWFAPLSICLLFLLPSAMICPTFYMQPGLLKAMILPPLMRTLPKTRFLFPTFHPKSTLLQILLSISKKTKKSAYRHGIFLKSHLKAVILHLLSSCVFIS